MENKKLVRLKGNPTRKPSLRCDTDKWGVLLKTHKGSLNNMFNQWVDKEISNIDILKGKPLKKYNVLIEYQDGRSEETEIMSEDPFGARFAALNTEGSISAKIVGWVRHRDGRPKDKERKIQVNFRLRKASADYVKSQHNQSTYIDGLIEKDMKENNIEHLK